MNDREAAMSYNEEASLQPVLGGVQKCIAGVSVQLLEITPENTRQPDVGWLKIKAGRSDL